jgi:hypothetical protein
MTRRSWPAWSPSRRRDALGAVIALALASGGGGLAAAHAAAPRLAAHAARSLNVTDSAHLRLIRASGSLLLEEGSASGALPGRTRASLDIGATFTGTVTVYARGGTISGHGSAVPHGSGRYESFAGSMRVTRGTGRFAHAKGSVRLYGTFDRRTYAFVVQTVGRISY